MQANRLLFFGVSFDARTAWMSTLLIASLAFTGCGLFGGDGDGDGDGDDESGDGGQGGAESGSGGNGGTSGSSARGGTSAGGTSGLGATGGNPQGGTAGSLGGSTSGSSTGGSAGNASSPRFLTFSANTMNLTEGQALVFSAVLTDPEGIDNLIGGVLEDAGSGATYGSFATAAAEGAYSMNVTWAEIDMMSSIDVAANATISRTFRARFFDVEGNFATAELDIAIGCEDDDCCDGAATNLTSDMEHCGTCNRACVGEFYCSESRCTQNAESFDPITGHALCAQVGGTCVEGTCGSFEAEELSCAAQPSEMNFVAVICVCEQP